MSIFSALPEDNFGLHVSTLRDKETILWLVNRIGEIKLRKSANKRGHYPDSPLFVSTIVKRFNLKVPNAIFSEQRVKICRVYLLVLKDLSAVKVGITTDWPGRAYAFRKNAKTGLADTFDLQKSVSIDLDCLADGRELEKNLLKTFSSSRTASPVERGLIAYYCGGHTEWFCMDIYENLCLQLKEKGHLRSLEMSVLSLASMTQMQEVSQ